MGFPETNPQVVQVVEYLAKEDEGKREIILMRVPKKGTVATAYAMSSGTITAASSATVVLYRRTSAMASSAIMGTAGPTDWGSTAIRPITLANNKAIAEGEHLTAIVSRGTASTASAFSISVGLTFVPGDPAAIGAIDA